MCGCEWILSHFHCKRGFFLTHWDLESHRTFELAFLTSLCNAGMIVTLRLILWHILGMQLSKFAVLHFHWEHCMTWGLTSIVKVRHLVFMNDASRYVCNVWVSEQKHDDFKLLKEKKCSCYSLFMFKLFGIWRSHQHSPLWWELLENIIWCHTLYTCHVI